MMTEQPVLVPDNVDDTIDWAPPGYAQPDDDANSEPVSSVHSHGDSPPEETS